MIMSAIDVSAFYCTTDEQRRMILIVLFLALLRNTRTLLALVLQWSYSHMIVLAVPREDGRKVPSFLDCGESYVVWTGFYKGRCPVCVFSIY